MKGFSPFFLQKKAMDDLNDVIESETASPQLKSNALIKRASLYIQRLALKKDASMEIFRSSL